MFKHLLLFSIAFLLQSVEHHRPAPEPEQPEGPGTHEVGWRDQDRMPSREEQTQVRQAD